MRDFSSETKAERNRRQSRERMRRYRQRQNPLPPLFCLCGCGAQLQADNTTHYARKCWLKTVDGKKWQAERMKKYRENKK